MYYDKFGDYHGDWKISFIINVLSVFCKYLLYIYRISRNITAAKLENCKKYTLFCTINLSFTIFLVVPIFITALTANIENGVLGYIHLAIGCKLAFPQVFLLGCITQLMWLCPTQKHMILYNNTINEIKECKHDIIPNIKLETIRYTESDHNTCVICLSDYSVGERLSRLECSHVYHNKCINEWFNTTLSCPTCRSDVTSAIPI